LLAPLATAKHSPQPSSQASSTDPAQDYLVYVVCEAADRVVLLRFGPHGIHEEHETHIGLLPVDINGPQGVPGQSVSIFDPKSGKELARQPTKRKVVHGAVVTPDNRYAFISVEGIGSDPGTAEVIDLDALKTVAVLDVPTQVAGIDFWKTEPSKP
jgi:hypothetical protein